MQFDIANASIEKLVIHKIGSISNDTHNIYSDKCLNFEQDSPVPNLLKQYFLATFNEPNLYNFTSPEGPSKNLVFQASKAIFENPDTFYEYSKLLADLLYQNSQHPNIKDGEFYLSLFRDVKIFDKDVQCIGIFKSETKETFLKICPDQGTIGIDCEEGINIKKLDKGCLIFEIEEENGYLISILDKTSRGNEAVFWKDDFLGLEIRDDNSFQTQNYMELCKEFVEQKYSPINEVPRENQIDLRNRTIEYFRNNDRFDENVFKDEILEFEDIKDAFETHKQEFEEKNNVILPQDFKISNDVVKKENSKFKSVIKLDKNFHVYVHGSQALIERGFDKEKNLYYYKLYFLNES